MKKISLIISVIIFIISCFIGYNIINKKEEIHFIPTIKEIDDGVKDIKFKVDTFYLAVGESEKLNYDIESSKDDYKLTWSSENEDIVSINEGKITGVSLGTAVVTLKSESGKKAEVSVTVTDLIRKPELDDKKSFLPCHAYTEEEAHIIDEALRTRVLNKGEGTRAALIETIRFMTLSFKYKVSYFYENGRMHESGVRKADGEGRYYHKGLYLSEDKFKDIKVSHKGPVIWGCPLTNLQDHNRYKPGAKMPNGLDCSGFVTWSLYNSGLDVGDIGAGINDKYKDMSDVGEMHSLTYEYANSDDYKVGDVIARWGHTALIAGKDSEYLYIAESLLKGVRIEKVSYKKPNSSLYKYYAYINKMDKEYSKNDDYTDMWE